MKNIDKEALFKNYVETAFYVFEEFNSLFTQKSISIYSSLVGLESQERPEKSDEEVLATAEEHMKGTLAWFALSEMYDYAVNGIAPKHLETGDLVNCLGDVIHFFDIGKYSLNDEWKYVFSKASARYALDDGQDLDVDQLATLGAVDVRTVRNAVSAGDLIAEKRDGTVYVNNYSALHWLIRRRGFKQTVNTSSNVQGLSEVTNASKFGSYLREQRIESYSDPELWDLTNMKSICGWKTRDLMDLESGVFNFSLHHVFPLADFYGLDRTLFLKAILANFFPDEYIALTKDEEGGNEKQD